MTLFSFQKYEQKAEKDRLRHEKEMEEYVKTLPPKRPMSSFMLFAQEVRPELMKSNPTNKVSEIGKLIGQKWNTLSETEKQVQSWFDGSCLFLFSFVRFRSFCFSLLLCYFRN